MELPGAHQEHRAAGPLFIAFMEWAAMFSSIRIWLVIFIPTSLFTDSKPSDSTARPPRRTSQSKKWPHVILLKFVNFNPKAPTI